MSARLLSDDLWNEIHSFFPVYQPVPQGGRPPIANRVVLTAILFVLKSGIAWEDLPLEIGCSYKTRKRRLQQWTRLGVWPRIFQHLLTCLPDRRPNGTAVGRMLDELKRLELPGFARTDAPETGDLAFEQRCPAGQEMPAPQLPVGPQLAAFLHELEDLFHFAEAQTL